MPRQVKRIIVEGMDGAGKTTLIHHLIDRIGNMKKVVNELGPKQDFNTWWPEQLDKEAGPIVPIHDRFFYSELVYGPILRGHITAEPILINNVLWFLRSGSFLIYARPTSQRLREGIKTNPQMEGVEDQFLRLLGLYDKLMMAEQEFYTTRFLQYVWHREGELEAVEQKVRTYLGSDQFS